MEMTVMNSDIRQAINIITQRITNLQQIKQMLLEEFDVTGGTSAAITVSPARHTNGNGNENGDLNRKGQLVKFLTLNGPASRGTINEKSGIPKGTIANLLNKEGFVRRHGKWDVDTSSATQETTH
jgi:hypothetical protein